MLICAYFDNLYALFYHPHALVNFGIFCRFHDGPMHGGRPLGQVWKPWTKARGAKGKERKQEKEVQEEVWPNLWKVRSNLGVVKLFKSSTEPPGCSEGSVKPVFSNFAGEVEPQKFDQTRIREVRPNLHMVRPNLPWVRPNLPIVRSDLFPISANFVRTI